MTNKTEQMTRLTSQARQQGGNAYRAQMPLTRNPYSFDTPAGPSLAEFLPDEPGGLDALAWAWDAGWVVAAIQAHDEEGEKILREIFGEKAEDSNPDHGGA